jgi:hypothetical protein
VKKKKMKNDKNIRKGITATLFAVMMVVSVLAVVPVVSATVTVYADNRPGWESALCCSYGEEDFTDAILNPGVSVVTDLGYVDTVNGVWWDNLICPGEPGGPTTTEWQFATPLVGFGGNWNPYVPSGPGSRIAVDVSGSWVYIGEIPETYENQFWGFVSTEPFDAVLLSSGSLCSGTPWCEKYTLDHMVYAQDTTPPVITCPLDVTVEQETADGTVVQLTATATDICDVDVDITSDELAIYPLGTTTVTFTATDDSGNSASCTTTVTVVDTTDPVITCPADEIVEQETADGTVVPLTATATDICDADPTITSDELAIYPLGTTTVTFTATDDSGNSATCTTTVTVVDTTDPVITCPLDVTVEQETADGTVVQLIATATDICDVDVDITSDELAIYPLGITTVTFTATDDAGNSATCTTTVTVVDTTDPIPECLETVNPHGNNVSTS